MPFIVIMLLRRMALLGFLAALPCSAAQWHEVSRNSETGATVSLDESTLSARQYIATGWVRIDYLAPRDRDGVSLNGYAAQWQANCQNRTYWPSVSFGFRPDNVEPVRLYNLAQQWQSPVPGGDEAVAVEALCEETKSLVGKAIDKVGEWFHEYVEGDK